jgi:heptosyltransferase-2
MGKFLIIQTASIGDVILTTPILETLHRKLPEAVIDILIKNGNETLFSSHPFLHRVITWNKDRKRYINLLKILFLIRKQRYNHVINVQRFASSGLLTAFSRAGVKSGFNKNPFSVFFDEVTDHVITTAGSPMHEVDRNLRLIKSIEPNGERKPKLYLRQEDLISTSSYKHHPYICIAPASLWFTKQYPAEKWMEFVGTAPRGYSVYFIGSENDRDLCEQIIKASGHIHAENLAGQLDYLQTAALMKDAQMNFVNDSAPQHLASAVDAPVTVIFCSTIPAFGFGPLSQKSHIIETREKLDCRPCGLHGFKQCPLKHYKCALTIDNEQLLGALEP